MSNRDKEREDMRKFQLSEEEERTRRERTGSSAESTNTSIDVNSCVNAEESVIPVTTTSGLQCRPMLQPVQFLLNIPEKGQKYVAIRPSDSGRKGPTKGRECFTTRRPQQQKLRPVYSFPVEVRNVESIVPTSISDFDNRRMPANAQRNSTASSQAKRTKFDAMPPLIRIEDAIRPSTSSSVPANEGSRGSMPPRREPHQSSDSKGSPTVKPALPVWMQGQMDEDTQSSADIRLQTTCPPELSQLNAYKQNKARKINNSFSTSAGKAFMPCPYPCCFLLPIEQGQMASTSSFNMQYEWATPVPPPMAHTNSLIDVKFSIAKILGKEDDSDIPEIPLDLRVARVTDPVRNVQPDSLPTEPPTATEEGSSIDDKSGKCKKRKKESSRSKESSKE